MRIFYYPKSPLIYYQFQNLSDTWKNSKILLSRKGNHQSQPHNNNPKTKGNLKKPTQNMLHSDSLQIQPGLDPQKLHNLLECVHPDDPSKEIPSLQNTGS